MLAPLLLALCSLLLGGSAATSSTWRLRCYGEAWRIRWAGRGKPPGCLAFPWSFFTTLSLGTSLFPGVLLHHLPNPVLTGAAGGIRPCSAPYALHHQKCHCGAGGETPPPPWRCPPLVCHAPATPGRGAGVSGPFFSPLAQAGQLLGLSPTGIQAGAEPPTPCSAGQGERGEGRRLEGRSSTGLAALGPQRGGCSIWLLRAFPLLPPHLPAGRAGRQGVRGEVRAAATNGGQSLAPAPRIGCSVAARCPVSPLFIPWSPNSSLSVPL